MSGIKVDEASKISLFGKATNSQEICKQKTEIFCSNSVGC